MSSVNRLSRAIQLAATMHISQMDKGGKPYILHPLWVMNKVRHLGEKYMFVAVLHDVVEDTEMTVDKIIDSFSLSRDNWDDLDIIEALELLNFHTASSYMGRIKEIIQSGNDIAKQVKLRDLEHNSKITRLKGISEKDLDRLKKYQKAYTLLSNNKK